MLFLSYYSFIQTKQTFQKRILLTKMNTVINETKNTISVSPMVLSYIKNMIEIPGKYHLLTNAITNCLELLDVDINTRERILLTIKMLDDEKWVTNDAKIMGFVAGALVFLYKNLPYQKITEIIADSLEDVEECKKYGIFTEKQYLIQCRNLIKFAFLHQDIRKLNIDTINAIATWENNDGKKMLNLKFPIYFDDICYDDPQYWNIKGVEEILV